MWAKRRSWCATLAEAVHYAHRKGVIHRDLKPSNILLGESGQAKIVNFGLAKMLDAEGELTRAEETPGTASYMAPEQALGDPLAIGPATDVYSLGAILYELLTGRCVFAGRLARETLRQVVDQEPVAAHKLRASIPADLEAICSKCLDKKPEKRYTTAAALAADLQRFSQASPRWRGRRRPWGGW